MKTRLEEVNELLEQNYAAFERELEVSPRIWELIEERCKLSVEKALLERQT